MPAGSSPLTRGARRAHHPDHLRPGIIPAHAGSTDHLLMHSGRLPDHPRSRGEHRPILHWSTIQVGSSPLTRGAPGVDAEFDADEGIIPAHAGSTWSSGMRTRGCGDHPRSRGEHVEHLGTVICLNGSSPLTRGAHQSSPHTISASRIIPAHAGSTCGTGQCVVAKRDHPRSRGEHIARAVFTPMILGSSPLTRGARGRARWFRTGTGIIPAHAGSTLRRRGSSRRRRDHPRSRGEHTCSPGRRSLARGSSPLTRGAPDAGATVVVVVGIIPAHAGSTAGQKPGSVGALDHPRSRGEHGLMTALGGPWGGSSPLTRGAPDGVLASAGGAGIIPAHAGSTTPTTGTRSGRRDHPRSRGEHTGFTQDELDAMGSSPLTRGALAGAPAEPPLTGIIPAHAGSTRTRREVSPRYRDHPRSRGEHGGVLSGTVAGGGSSPLTRGALPRRLLADRLRGIIPAHAGSTRR